MSTRTPGTSNRPPGRPGRPGSPPQCHGPANDEVYVSAASRCIARRHRRVARIQLRSWSAMSTSLE